MQTCPIGLMSWRCKDTTFFRTTSINPVFSRFLQYQIKDNDVFEKAYSYIEMYY